MQFYTRVLVLRFVKKSVNQDDPGTYHLYYGDYAGSPGTILTFFPWAGLRRGRPGSGQAYATGFSVPAGTLPYWQKRFNEFKVERSEEHTPELHSPDHPLSRLLLEKTK